MARKLTIILDDYEEGDYDTDALSSAVSNLEYDGFTVFSAREDAE